MCLSEFYGIVGELDRSVGGLHDVRGNIGGGLPYLIQDSSGGVQCKDGIADLHKPFLGQFCGLGELPTEEGTHSRTQDPKPVDELLDLINHEGLD